MSTVGRNSKEVLRLVCGTFIRSYSRVAFLPPSSYVLSNHRSRLLVDHARLWSTSSVVRSSESVTNTEGSTATGTVPEEVLLVQIVDGLHELTVPMVSRRERCRFTLQPFEDTLGDLLNHISKEDRAIVNVYAQTEDGEVLSVTTSLDALLKRSFYLFINKNRYLVRMDQSTDRLLPTPDSTDSLRHLVSSLYRTINLDQYYAIQHRQLLAQQSELLMKLEPMEKIKKEMEQRAEKRTQFLSWLGLGLMGAQFGFMARLTWWEYSWDVMEPVTYFVGYATTIAMFAYYVITRQEYLYPDTRDREYLVTLHRRSKSHRFDLGYYNELRTQLACVERDIQRLRDPLEVHLGIKNLPPANQQS